MGATARKAALVVASTALALGALAGCGSDSDGGSDGGSSAGGASAGGDASKDDFCTAFNGLVTDVLAKAGTGDLSDAVSAIKDWAANMKEVGTPSDMPDDARQGFEVFVEAASNIDEDATLGDLQSLGSELSQADQDAGESFGSWATENCPAALPGIGDPPSELPSDMASLMPSDLPTDPSALESMMSELTASAG